MYSGTSSTKTNHHCLCKRSRRRRRIETLGKVVTGGGEEFKRDIQFVFFVKMVHQMKKKMDLPSGGRGACKGGNINNLMDVKSVDLFHIENKIKSTNNLILSWFSLFS